VADALKKEGIQTEIVIIETKGDKILNIALSKIGSKGIFTEELEQKLFSKEIDIAVHSAKDLPSTLPHGLEIIAFSERELVNDVLVSFKPQLKITDANITIGTSSTRRVAMLKHYYPHAKVVDMRGNLQTRFEKLKNGACDAMILAYAGVHRMNYDDFIIAHLDKELFTPPTGQGSVAIESSTELEKEKKDIIRKAINHIPTELCLLAERSFLKTINGGCSIPTFAHATWINNSEINLKAGIISLDGSEMLVDFLTFDAKEAIVAGSVVAKKVLNLGGDKILAKIKEHQNQSNI
jgi:hydroxymethylbilane synthase